MGRSRSRTLEQASERGSAVLDAPAGHTVPAAELSVALGTAMLRPVEARRSGHPGGAALDVSEREPQELVGIAVEEDVPSDAREDPPASQEVRSAVGVRPG